MRRIFSLILLICLLSFVIPIQPTLAQSYWFAVERETVDVYWESDGTMRIEYTLVFRNDPSALPLDYLDIGVPTSDYDISSVQAWLDGNPISDIGRSSNVSAGVKVDLGSRAIGPGRTGVLQVSIGKVRDVLYFADEEGYASGLFSPSWFGSQYAFGPTDITVRFHLPPGVQPEEPRWHEAPAGWPQEPATGLDQEGRVLYEWRNQNANPYTAYVFGTSFPVQYIPEEVLQDPDVGPAFTISDDMIGLCCFGGFLGLIVLIIAISVYAQRRRKLDYLPPKIAIEGHGIKRGLTAVEAAILLETPLDRVLTMILFGVIKKEAARVTKEEPLEIELTEPTPEGLRIYETAFLKSMAIKKKADRQRSLQKLTVNLVKSIQKKMKGFSLKETKAYYRSIVKEAWVQVESAETPEVKSEKFAENLEWSMLDKDFDDRTHRTFRTGPVFLPGWWGMYRPSSIPSASAGGPTATPGRVTVTHSKGGGASLPSLPGSQFASSVVTGVQSAAGNLVSNLTSFTGGVTKTTNPPPPPSRASSGGRPSSGGSSCACACACACAGCACACAGGGR